MGAIAPGLGRLGVGQLLGQAQHEAAQLASSCRLVSRSVGSPGGHLVVGVGLGALIRNQVAAIVIVLAFTQVIEPILRLAGSFVDWVNEVTRFLPGAASDALVGASFYSALAGADGSASGALAWWQGGLVLLGFAVVFAVLAQLFSWRRDVD
ncbi:MAG: hypothetical protein KDB08_08550 [Microthrixaceae bacterium]|nr:hypothetical protein [Microthrixaceae bacterium]